jgi:XTP/dITP diphosphohydrolase
MDVLLATANRHKIAEYRRLLNGSAIQVMAPHDAGLRLLEVAENGATFLANASTKAIAYVQEYSMTCLSDDSGICVDALAGAPGIRSTRFGSPELDDSGRVRYLLECMKEVPAYKRGAHYVCALALAQPGLELMTVVGRFYGEVAFAPSAGSTGFGYDPIFVVPRYGLTVADLSPQDKDAISHRGKAIGQLLEILGREGNATGTL